MTAPGWQTHLKAVRVWTRARPTPGQEVWDRDWQRWRGIALRAGRGQLEAAEVAYTRTEAQHGPRPEPKETQT